MDISLFDQAAQVAPAAKHVAKCIPQIKTVTHNIGVTHLTAIISTAVGVVVAGIVGYFVGKRGLTGTKTDLTNAEAKVSQVATEVKSAVAPTPVA